MFRNAERDPASPHRSGSGRQPQEPTSGPRARGRRRAGRRPPRGAAVVEEQSHVGVLRELTARAQPRGQSAGRSGGPSGAPGGRAALGAGPAQAPRARRPLVLIEIGVRNRLRDGRGSPRPEEVPYICLPLLNAPGAGCEAPAAFAGRRAQGRRSRPAPRPSSCRILAQRNIARKFRAWAFLRVSTCHRPAGELGRVG